MSTTELRGKVQEELNDADEHILRAILAMMKEYKKSLMISSGLTDEQWQIVMEREARYKRGQTKGYSWEEVKAGLKKKI